MCGLAGIFTGRGRSPEELESVARQMAGTIRHRGPDDAGLHVEGEDGLAFGFRRLSIIDPTPTGKQPMSSASGRYVVMLNGEVYNFPALRRELERDGTSFRGTSDTEVVAHGFDRWGVRQSLERFVGMFAIACWDREEQRLLLARDRLGIKPLYLYWRPGTLGFASELKALAEVPGFGGELDRTAIVSYLRYLYVPTPRSIFSHVRKLPPGHLLEIHSPEESPRSSSYWSLAEVARRGLEDPFTGSEAEAADELEALLEEAVRVRLRSDVPLGALLSGGIDSTAVVALAQDATPSPLRTFTIAFDSDEHDESVHAAEVADHLGTDHRELRLTGHDAREVIPTLPEIFDEPLADPSQIPTFCVSRLAREEVTVALSGDGGDEVFGGYNRYVFGEDTIRWALRIPRPLRKALAAAAGAVPERRWERLHGGADRFLPSLLRHRLAGEKIRKLGRLVAQDSAGSMYTSLLSSVDDPARFVRGGREPEAPDLDDSLALLGSGRLLDGMQYLDQKCYLPDDLLAKVDRASMAVSLEVRVPVLDHRLVQFAWRLPPDYRVRDGVGKRPLREIVRRRVPSRLVDRPKVGFSVPLRDWLKGPLRDWAGDLLVSSDLDGEEVLETDRVQETWDRFDQGESGLAALVWALLMLQAWRDRWL